MEIKDQIPAEVVEIQDYFEEVFECDKSKFLFAKKDMPLQKLLDLHVSNAHQLKGLKTSKIASYKNKGIHWAAVIHNYTEDTIRQIISNPLVKSYVFQEEISLSGTHLQAYIMFKERENFCLVFHRFDTPVWCKLIWQLGDKKNVAILSYGNYCIDKKKRVPFGKVFTNIPALKERYETENFYNLGSETFSEFQKQLVLLLRMGYDPQKVKINWVFINFRIEGVTRELTTLHRAVLIENRRISSKLLWANNLEEVKQAVTKDPILYQNIFIEDLNWGSWSYGFSNTQDIVRLSGGLVIRPMQSDVINPLNVTVLSYSLPHLHFFGDITLYQISCWQSGLDLEEVKVFDMEEWSNKLSEIGVFYPTDPEVIKSEFLKSYEII